MNHKKIVAMLMLSTSILSAVGTDIAHASTSKNEPKVVQKADQEQGNLVPDANLRQALIGSKDADGNVVISSEADITKENLAKITDLSASDNKISNIEGLQYCTSLTSLFVGGGATDVTSNTISDLSPLAKLAEAQKAQSADGKTTQLKYLHMRSLQVKDFSPLSGFTSLQFNHLVGSSYLGIQSIWENVESNSFDGSYTMKNPLVDIDGSIMVPDNLAGGTYDKATNTITWTKDQIEANTDHKGESHPGSGTLHNFVLTFKSKMTQGKDKNGNLIDLSAAQAIGGDYHLRILEKSPLKAANDEVNNLFENQTPTWNGLKTDVTQGQYDKAKALYDALSNKEEPYLDDQDDKVTKDTVSNNLDLASVLLHIQHARHDTYSLFKGEDPTSNQLAKGVTLDTITTVKDEVQNLDDKKDGGQAKKDLLGIVNKASDLFTNESVEQDIKLGGMGIGSAPSGFARVTLQVKDGKATLVKNSNYQFHWGGWKASTYASIQLTDPNGKDIGHWAWRGNQAVSGGYGAFATRDLPEGSTVEVYHAEGPWHRFSTSDNDDLKTGLGNAGYTYTYKMHNNQLILTTVK